MVSMFLYDLTTKFWPDGFLCLYHLWYKSGIGIWLPVMEMREMSVQSLGWEDPLEEEMATHSSTLVWKIPWTEELGRLQPVE